MYGLGLSGLAASRLLLSRGVEVVAVDDRPEDKLRLGDLREASGFELVTGGELKALPANLDGVVVSPGVPSEKPLLQAARQAGLAVISEVELAFPLLDGPVIGITGTNGKSTTTELTGAILRVAGRAVEVCGNIGEPISGRVDGPKGRLFVVELSSFQLENLVTFQPDAAALLNLSPDHLDRYEGFEAYVAAKGEIFRNQGPENVAVVNGDDPAVVAMTAQARARRRMFSRSSEVEDGCFLADGTVWEAVPGAAPSALFQREDLSLDGAHNLENAMAASLLARRFGAESNHLKVALGGFQGLPHRMERVGEGGRVAFYNDSKGTNVAATSKSLEDLPDGSVHLILGGVHKGDDPRLLADLVRRKVRRLYLIGESADTFRSALEGVVAAEVSETLERAVASAAESAEAGEVVLLSPACASFDQFSNYAQRGDAFRSMVSALPEAIHG